MLCIIVLNCDYIKKQCNTGHFIFTLSPYIVSGPAHLPEHMSNNHPCPQ